MKFLSRIFQKLGSPYPAERQFNLSELVIKVAVITFFVVLINLSSGIEAKDLTLVFGFSLGMFFMLIFNFVVVPKLLPQVFNEKHWVVWKQILWILFLFFSIATLNFVLFSIVGVSVFNVDSYWRFIVTTVALGIAPVVMIVLFEENRKLKENLTDAQTINQQLKHQNSNDQATEEMILLESSVVNQEFSVKPSNILFVEAADNYVIIHYLTGDVVANEMIRNTLKSMQEQLAAYPEFIRCHRTFIVNTGHVTKVEGNAQGLNLTVNKHHVPVSRSYVKTIKSMLV